MAKHQYVVRASNGQSHAGFKTEILETLAPAVMGLGSFHLKLTFTDRAPPRLTVIPFRREPVAVVSLAGEALPEASQCAEVLGVRGYELAAYSVTEALPCEYDKDWPDGTVTPGIGLLTLFRRKPGQGDSEFLERWHEGHTPLTLRTHPVWNYVRNVVDEPILDGSPLLDGIVEEHFRTSADLLNPGRFFGGLPSMASNMVRVALDIRRFIDLKTIETYLAAEVHLRS
jgi:hypothetical protein